MARVTYSHQLNAAGIRALVASPQGGIGQDLLRRGLRVETLAKRNLAGGPSGPKRIDTGRLRSSVITVVVMRNGEPAVLVGTNVFYARYVHYGTGIYGPRHRMIRPRTARFLRFTPKGKTGVVYARAVRGVVPNRFLRDALPAARR